MTDTNKIHEKTTNLLLDPKKPVDVRAKMLVQFVTGLGDPEAMEQLARALLVKMSSAGAAAEVDQLRERFQQALHELEQGPLRPATFIAKVTADLPGPQPRAEVVTPDGHRRYPFLHPRLEKDDLDCGTSLVLDAKGTVVLGHTPELPHVGPEAMFLRRVPNTDLVQVEIRDEAVIMYAAKCVLDAESSGDLARGDKLLICPNRNFAFRPVPTDQDRRHRFIDSNRVPDVVPGRDIGRPHPCLSWLTKRTRIMMFREDLCRRFDLRPRISLMMTGPSGTGKTLTIKGFLNVFHQMVRERTQLEENKTRVVRMKLSEQLSHWLGKTDKNFEDFFDDVQWLASTPVTTAGGETILLPCAVIIEEVDSVAVRRSGGTDNHDGTGGVMDRIMGTLLQRLDDPLDELSKLPIVLITTSNRPEILDSAMRRRLQAKAAVFTRLDRDGFAAVLDKKIRGHYPLATRNGTPKKQLRRQVIDEVVADLFSPQNDGEGLVEITLRDGEKIVKHHRSFLTGSLVESALTAAIDELVFLAEESPGDDIGLDSARLAAALKEQIESLAAVMTPVNAGDYVDLPEDSHVARVRRLRANGRPASSLVVYRE